MPPAQSARSLAAIVFTDVVGYSALSHRDDANALRLVEEHFRMVRQIAPGFGGRVIKTIGDSVHLEFASAQSATACAIAIQQRHQQRNARVAEAQQFQIRIGVHLGDVERRDGDVYGDGVNVAARLQPQAPVGGIAISGDVRRQLPEELRARFAARGAQELRNIATPIEIFAIEAEAIAQVAVETPSAAPVSPRPRRWPSQWAIITVGVIGLMLFIAKPWRYGPDGKAEEQTSTAAPSADAAISDKSIAVLPFADLSAAHDQEYFADGMAEELLNSLAKIKQLKVAGRTSSFSFKGKNEDLRMIAKALAVAHILEGSVRKQGNKVRITAQLIQAADGYHLWSETYDRDLKDIFAVQSEIASAVAEQLKLTLLGSEASVEQTRPDAPPNGNVDAYQAVLQGNFHYDRQNPADLHKAIEHYDRAIALEPGYALAHAKRAKTTMYLGGYFGGFSAEELKRYNAESHASIAAALKLSPDLAEARAVHCAILAILDLDFASARPECQRAYDLAPQDPEVVLNQAYGLANRGKLDEAATLCQKTIALDPLSGRAYRLMSRLAARNGNFEEAEPLLRKAIDLQPQASQNYANLAVMSARKGRTHEAVELAKQETNAFWRTFGLALAYHANGDRAQADAALNQLIAENSMDGAYQIADVYAYRKEPDKAFEWLDKSWAVRDPGVSLILWDGFFAPYEKDPRYAAFAKKIGVLQE
jgi:serine/threonine-protein kinase